MGGILSYKGKTDDPDPITGLTSRDKYLIDSTWSTVMQDATGNGVKFFLKLFEINPKHKEALPFRDQPTEKLAKDKKFQAHVTNVMYSISSLVKTLNEPEVINAIIDKIAQNHSKRAVDRPALLDVKKALLETLIFLDVEQKKAWTKFMDYFIEVASKSLDKYSKQ